MAGRTFDLFPRKLFITLNVLLAMRAGEFEFAHRLLRSCLVRRLAADFERCSLRCNPSATSKGLSTPDLNPVFNDLARHQPDPGNTVLQTLRGSGERPGGADSKEREANCRGYRLGFG